MSSTERAPEPTMEEILASIRRIISEDEANAARQEAAPEGYVQPSVTDDVEEGVADTQIIADIERVLAGQSGQAEPSEDEILDLTVAGALVEAEAVPESVEELVVTEVVEEVAVEPAQAPSFMQAFPPAPEEAPEPAAPEEPVEGMEAPAFEAAPPYEAAAQYETPQYAAEEPQPEPQPTYAEPPAPEPVSASPPAEDPTAALERAIAALKAGDLAAFAREAESKYAPPAAPSMRSAAPPSPAYEPLPETGPTLAEQFEAPEEPQPLVEEELVILSEPEPGPEADEPTISSAPEERAAPERVATPWHGDEATWAPRTTPPEFVTQPAPRTNGGSGHKAHDFAVQPPKSLEDSVKEMLRPMLRKWLDENMQRVLTQALREELEDPEARRRQG